MVGSKTLSSVSRGESSGRTVLWRITQVVGVQALAATFHMFVVFWGWRLLTDFWDTPVEGLVMGHYSEVVASLFGQWLMWVQFLPFLHHDYFSLTGVILSYIVASVAVYHLSQRIKSEGETA